MTLHCSLLKFGICFRYAFIDVFDGLNVAFDYFYLVFNDFDVILYWVNLLGTLGDVGQGHVTQLLDVGGLGADRLSLGALMLRQLRAALDLLGRRADHGAVLIQFVLQFLNEFVFLVQFELQFVNERVSLSQFFNFLLKRVLEVA